MKNDIYRHGDNYCDLLTGLLIFGALFWLRFNIYKQVLVGCIAVCTCQTACSTV